jgi:RNA:NAD 2'-phosphotransferase (TPT1/KptA family)
MHRKGHRFFVSKNGVWLTAEAFPSFVHEFKVR